MCVKRATERGVLFLAVDLVVVCPVFLLTCQWINRGCPGVPSTEVTRHIPLTKVPEQPAGSSKTGGGIGGEVPVLVPALGNGSASASPPQSTPEAVCRALDKTPSYWHGFRTNLTAWEEFDQVFALNKTLLEKAYVPGDSSRLTRVLQKMARREKVTVMAYGGSFVMGSNCGETREQRDRDCAWPSRVKRWWEAVLPDFPAVFSNKACSGISERVFLNSIGPILQELKRAPPDLMMLDFTVNSNHMVAPGDMRALTETLLRTLLEHLPETQLLYFIDGCHPCMKFTLEAGKNVPPHYQVPMIDYHGVVEQYNKDFPGGPDRLWPHTEPPYNGPYLVVGSRWPDFSPHLSVLHGVCCGDVHPPWPVHQYYADIVGFALLRMLASACQGRGEQKERPVSAIEPLASEEELKKVHPVCLLPRAVYDARAPAASLGLPPPETTPSGSWALLEDRPGRPGWISALNGSSIRFRVRFGPQATLLITYLRSYESVGKVRMTMRVAGSEVLVHPKASLLVDARWEKRFSVPYTQIMFDGWGPLVHALFNKSQRDNMTWTIRAGGEAYLEYDLLVQKLEDGDKFKIISVISC